MSFSQNEATRLVRAVDRRVQKQLGRGTVLEYTQGEVDVVGVGEASAFLGGDTNASEGFRIPPGIVVESGDRVRVAIDPRGDRYITGVISPTSYPKATFDPVRGAVALGDGTAAPAQGLRYDSTNDIVVFDDGALGDTGATHHLGELRLYRASGAQYVLLTDTTNLNASQVAFAMKNNGEMQWGPSGAARDVALTRDTTGRLMVTKAAGSTEPRVGVQLSTGHASAASGWFVWNEGDTVPRASLGKDSTGHPGIFLGDGSAATDANIIRSAASELSTGSAVRLTNGNDVSLTSTDHAFQIGSDGGANIRFDANEIMAASGGVASDLFIQNEGGRVRINAGNTPTTTADGLVFGTDVNLYRGGTNLLKTDDHLQVGGLTIKVKAGIPTDSDSFSPASGNVILDTTNSRIYFRVGSTWKFAALT